MRPGEACGFSYVELIVVLALLSLISLVAVSTTTGSGRDERLGVATHELADALRFARSEALRTFEVRGVRIDHTTDAVTVYRPDLSGGSVVIAETLLHPLSKRPYTFVVGLIPLTSGATIANTQPPFSFSGLGVAEADVLFDARGYPFLMKAGTWYVLAAASISVSHGGESRDVVLSQIGRVTLQ